MDHRIPISKKMYDLRKLMLPHTIWRYRIESPLEKAEREAERKRKVEEIFQNQEAETSTK